MTRREELEALAARVEGLTGADAFDWCNLPSWAQEGREHFDGNWTPDCNGKLDYDPGFLRFSCRVWNDGSYIASAIVGGDTDIASTGVVHAVTVKAARIAVEAWCADQATRWAAVIANHLRALAQEQPA